MTMIATRHGLAGLLLLALVLAGCAGGERTGTVEGKVTYEGKPIPKGAVKFSYAVAGGTKEMANEKTGPIMDGKYKVEDVPAGPVTIMVMTTDLPDMWLKKDERGNPIPSPDYMPIPGKYSFKEKSGLTYEVKPGPQTYDIDLK
jgi:hypothetical protein